MLHAHDDQARAHADVRRAVDQQDVVQVHALHAPVVLRRVAEDQERKQPVLLQHHAVTLDAVKEDLLEHGPLQQAEALVAARHERHVARALHLLLLQQLLELAAHRFVRRAAQHLLKQVAAHHRLLARERLMQQTCLGIHAAELIANEGRLPVPIWEVRLALTLALNRVQQRFDRPVGVTRQRDRAEDDARHHQQQHDQRTGLHAVHVHVQLAQRQPNDEFAAVLVGLVAQHVKASVAQPPGHDVAGEPTQQRQALPLLLRRALARDGQLQVGRIQVEVVRHDADVIRRNLLDRLVLNQKDDHALAVQVLEIAGKQRGHCARKIARLRRIERGQIEITRVVQPCKKARVVEVNLVRIFRLQRTIGHAPLRGVHMGVAHQIQQYARAQTVAALRLCQAIDDRAGIRLIPRQIFQGLRSGKTVNHRLHIRNQRVKVRRRLDDGAAVQLLGAVAVVLAQQHHQRGDDDNHRDQRDAAVGYEIPAVHAASAAHGRTHAHPSFLCWNIFLIVHHVRGVGKLISQTARSPHFCTIFPNPLSCGTISVILKVNA